MGAFGCARTVNVLNFLFDDRVLRNSRDQMLTRLRAGEQLSAVLLSSARRFPRFNQAGRIQELESVVNAWPAEQLEAVRSIVIWALMSHDTNSPIKLRWKGDAEYHETVTKFEVKDGELLIEFAHPPVEVARLSA